ncbi:MAG: hypothetical protein A2033_08670 [Bacteroidetes bacterium GWA2_31_9]|nr:MAG: hypothetical protein A2033_08670 [Bacteroidetes bacterium GWA2_31_9]
MKYNFKLFISYLHLSKATLSLAVATSSYVGYSLTKNTNIVDSIILILGVFLLSGAASALNQFQERNTDLLMQRTANRPIPSKNISPKNALIFSISLIIIGTFCLSALNYYCALLGLLNIVFYNFIYTPLKYKSQFALIPGGFVGAIPPLIGWFTSGNNDLSPAIIFVSAFMFLWQIPHFWILLIKYQTDYKNAKIKNVTESISLNKINFILFIWILSTSILTFSFPLFGIITSSFNLVSLIVLNVFLVAIFSKVLFKNLISNQLKLANLSLHLYLVLIFVIIIVDKITYM